MKQTDLNSDFQMMAECGSEQTFSEPVEQMSETEVNSSARKLVEKATREFHAGRCLLVKYLPPDVKQEEISTLLEGYFSIRHIYLDRTTRTARVYVNCPEVSLENWSSETHLSVRGCHVNASGSPSEQVLCVAHLPLIYSEEDFKHLVQMCGPLVRCFLMRSRKYGCSKGYGFVEFTSKSVALQAKNILDRKTIGDCTLRCDWLDPSHVTYASLESRCLFVDHLPPDFRDVDELRRIFSIVIKPIYCQIILRNNRSTGIALVEFSQAEDAEETQRQLNGYSVDKHKIRVSFCIPGVHAMTICNKLSAELNMNNNKKPLLPDPQSSVQSPLLALQNGLQFFHNLQMAKGLFANPINNAAQMQAAMVLFLAAQSQQNGHQHQPVLTNTEKEEKKSPLRRNPLLPNPPLRKSLLPTPPRNEFLPTRKNQPHWDNEESHGKNYWKTPLLGDRPRGYLPDTPTPARSPLLGDRPPPSSLSPTSSVSSLASDIADRNTSSPSLMNSSTATPPRTPEAVAQLHSQLESLGNNPLMNLLLQAAQKSNCNVKCAGSNPLLTSPTKSDGTRRSLLGDFPGSVPWMSVEKRKYDGERDFREINKMCDVKRLRK